MKVATDQPQYLPWLGYLDKLDSADVFILLDTVQLKKHEWQNRNRIRTKEGWQWLNVPIIDRYPERIDQVEINSRSDWRRKHSQALHLFYGKALHWEPLGPQLLGLLEKPWTRMAELNVAVIGLICRYLAMRTSCLLASRLSAREEHIDRLINLCQAAGGTEYLAGQAGPAYMDVSRFAQAGIPVRVPTYHHPEYLQRYTPFVSQLSVIDLLSNCGPESLDLLRLGRLWEPHECHADDSRRDAETQRGSGGTPGVGQEMSPARIPTDSTTVNVPWLCSAALRETGPKMKDLNSISGSILEAAFRIHSALGPGLLESVYEVVLAHELEKRGLKLERQKSVPVEFEGSRFEEGFRADLNRGELHRHRTDIRGGAFPGAFKTALDLPSRARLPAWPSHQLQRASH